MARSTRKQANIRFKTLSTPKRLNSKHVQTMQNPKLKNVKRCRFSKTVVTSGGVLSEGYEHDWPGVCLGDGLTESYLKDMDMTGLASVWAMA